jgi:predicted Zn-dependent peptidase
VEVNAGQQATQLQFECEAADLAAVLQLAGEVVSQPLLPQEKLDLVKAQVGGGRRRRGEEGCKGGGEEEGRKGGRGQGGAQGGEGV